VNIASDGKLELAMNGHGISSFSNIGAMDCRTGIEFELPPELIAAAKAWMRVQGAAFDMVPQLEI
jgi:hypothetical protein